MDDGRLLLGETTAALLGGTTAALLGGRRVRRQLPCWVGEDYYSTGREKGGATAALLDGRGLLRCWVGQRWTTVALLDGVGGRQLPCLVDNGCAARWERIGLLDGRTVGQRLTCWVGEKTLDNSTTIDKLHS